MFFFSVLAMAKRKMHFSLLFRLPSSSLSFTQLFCNSEFPLETEVCSNFNGTTGAWCSEWSCCATACFRVTSSWKSAVQVSDFTELLVILQNCSFSWAELDTEWTVPHFHCCPTCAHLHTSLHLSHPSPWSCSVETGGVLQTLEKIPGQENQLHAEMKEHAAFLISNTEAFQDNGLTSLRWASPREHWCGRILRLPREPQSLDLNLESLNRWFTVSQVIPILTLDLWKDVFLSELRSNLPHNDQHQKLQSPPAATRGKLLNTPRPSNSGNEDSGKGLQTLKMWTWSTRPYGTWEMIFSEGSLWRVDPWGSAEWSTSSHLMFYLFV